MSTPIPPRQGVDPVKPRRFLVSTPILDYLALQEEAAKRDVDLLSLAGSVLSHWVAIGCPDSIAPSKQ